MREEAGLTSTRHSGNEKRMFERHPVDIDAIIKSANRGESRRKIRDFCIGGMLLVEDDYPDESSARPNSNEAVNDLIQIQCTLPAAAEKEGRPCLFEARVVRIDAVSIGVAFINPDLVALQGLMDYVKASNQSVYAAATPRVEVDGEYRQIAQQCCAMVKAGLEPLMLTSIETLVSRLFESSRETRDTIEQNSYFEALGILNKLQSQLVKRFVSSANAQLDVNALVKPPSAQESATNLSLDELSLVEEETLDNWLADTGTIEAVERTHREEFDALNKRLSVVFDSDVDRKNSPFGPSLYSQSFQEAIQDIGLRHNVSLFAYKVFKDVFIDELGELYRQMNALLVSSGILPEFRYSLPTQEREPETPAAGGKPDIALLDAEPVAEEGVTGSQGSSQGSAGRNSPALPESEQDIYALVDELRELRSRLGAREQDTRQGQPGHETDTSGVNTWLADSAAGKVADSSAEQSRAEKVLFTQSEVLRALSNVEQNITRLDRSEIRKSIAAALMSSSDASGKQVAGREERIINVSTSIFDTMLSDLQVPVNMREWLGRLEMPVLKMAIHDDSLYKDSDHLVRQVVNKIAKLGLLVGEEETEGQTGIRNALDWLINLINKDFDGTNTVFRRVSDQLDVLVKAQNKKYKDNIHKVIRYIEAHKGDLAVDEDLADSQQQDDAAALEEWRRRVGRLAENDWILFDANSDNPVRLKVAWLAKHTGKIVFVDAEGRKKRVLQLDNLAHSLSLGNAQTIDDANTPTMDRAQYTTLQKLHRDLIYQSTHDSLTTLINRREFEKQLVTALAESRGAGVQHALCFLDIDQFKVINSNHSNRAGDELLMQLAGWVNTCLAEWGKTTFARLGGDEFGIIFHECSLEDSLARAEELIEYIHKQTFEWQSQRTSVSVSLGLTQITELSDDISGLMQAAESSCDIARQTGGNRLQLYYAGSASLSRRKQMISWVTKIDDILDSDSLQLRCQKIQPINMRAGEIEHVHYEILLGLKPEHGDLPSIQEFIEAAEYSNRVGDIDRWVVRSTLAWLAENEQVLDIINAFSINLSGKSLSDETFIDFVLEQIEESDIPAECLCFEITETAGIENLSDAAHFINTIKDTGCRFSLDDFGSGMSSYAYLRDLPVDYLKIDGMFIKNIHNNESDYAVVKSITEVAHFMGKRVIAEYVENDDIVNKLTEIGVDFAQGFGIDKPHLIGELI
ncbi:DUF1631 family protein [Sulfuriflexus sp.]|uniref:DUF1631 family protein n=1 Tax=Sulfuriflexus sp. TaxID=2015443 RepID=UPI0028CCACDB|nr:DUF1631 family protein [Sulfuriflexus sp.]MDT8403411.1 DUF1631 family protein [Sulfuriflexus sp.]